MAACSAFDAHIITAVPPRVTKGKNTHSGHAPDGFYYIDLGWRHQYVGIERLLLDGIVIYLVDNEFYFGDRIYLGGEAEGEQYAFFARAILEALPRLDFTPEILHCNDWHTAVLPMLMKHSTPAGCSRACRRC
ncbi:MAG: glycogen/starch synthase [Oscillospiraceae bacterium]